MERARPVPAAVLEKLPGPLTLFLSRIANNPLTIPVRCILIFIMALRVVVLTLPALSDYNEPMQDGKGQDYPFGICIRQLFGCQTTRWSTMNNGERNG
jgi:hypothetical protein